MTNSIVIRNYSKVIDQVRPEEFRKAAGDDREVLKGTKYLLKNRENLIEE
ncbi:MAG TPA: transposase [Anaerolineae bacterium]|nr:transposase [Anaerolineae bacterium]